MKYYEDKYGLHGVAVLPPDVTELTEEEYEERLAEIRAYAEENPLEDAATDGNDMISDDET